MRGSKKDFIDLYFILKKYSLNKLFNNLEEKYPGTDFNRIYILKSLVYFADAENQPMQKMHKKVSWPKIKKTFTKQVENFKLN